MAELDAMIGIPGFSAELDLVVGKSMREALGNQAQRWRDAGAPLSRSIEVSGAVSAAQAGLAQPAAYFAFADQPNAGRYWSVRKVSVMAGSAGANVVAAPFAAALSNVTAALFVTQGAMATQLNNPPPPIDADQVAFAVPSTQFYSTHQLWVRGGEWLVLGLFGSGVTSGLQVFGRARLLEIDDDPRFLLDL